MNAEQPEMRRQVYLAVDTVVKSRKRGKLPAKRREIRKQLGEIDNNELELAIQTLKRWGLIIQAGGGWYAEPIDLTDFCWIHGRIECRICQ